MRARAIQGGKLLAFNGHGNSRDLQAQLQQQQHFRACGLRLRKKTVSLVLLVVQTTLLVLLMRHTRSSGTAEDRYLSSTAVVSGEVLKIVLSVLAIWYGHYCSSTGLAEEVGAGSTTTSVLAAYTATVREISQELAHRDTLKLAVPGLLYLVQNNLLFIALSNLDAAVYQVTYQLKILTTAMFSVFMLGRRLDVEQIFALLLLTAGVSLVQYAEMLNTTSTGGGVKEDDASSTTSNNNNDPVVGLSCVLLACFSSGFAGVYLEKVMKRPAAAAAPTVQAGAAAPAAAPPRTVSLWMRNVQLGMFGAAFGLGGIWFSRAEMSIVTGEGFFRGYTWLVWLVVVIQALGGLLVAAVIQYADNIAKGFATSISIVLSSLVSVYLFGFRIGLHFFVGASLVIAAVFLFGRDKSLSKPAAPVAAGAGTATAPAQAVDKV